MRQRLFEINAFLVGSWATALTWGPTNVGLVILGVWVGFLVVGMYLVRRHATPAA